MGNKVVFDTNILVSKIITEKLANFAVWIFMNNIKPLYSLPSENELRTVLNYEKFAKYKIDIQGNIDFYKSICEYCRTIPQFTGCADPKDNYLFDLAIQGKAQYLVSSDKIVLSTPTPGRKFKKLTFPQFKEDIQ